MSTENSAQSGTELMFSPPRNVVTQAVAVPSSGWRTPKSCVPRAWIQAAALATAFCPSSGMDECAVRPRAVTITRSEPLWAKIGALEVGSATIRSSAGPRTCSRPTWKAPSQPVSSPAVITRVRPRWKRGSSASTLQAAAMKAATPAFMSLAPRPYSRPSWTIPAKGGNVQGFVPTGTTSIWPVKQSGLPLPVPGMRATRVGRSSAKA